MIEDVSTAERVAQLHGDAIVIDGHCDILMPAVAGVTALDTPWPVQEVKRWQAFLGDVGHVMKTAPAGQYELPLLEQGGVTAQAVAVYTRDEDLDIALERALESVVTLGRHVARNEARCLLATRVSDIERAKAEDKVAYVLTFEGAEPLGRRPEFLEVFARLGLRMVSLTHDRRTWLADGTLYGPSFGNVTPSGLTKLGKEAIRLCQELGIVLDVVHLSDRSFWEVVELGVEPIVCSHAHLLMAAPYAAAWDEVNPTYGMTKAQAIARTGGLIGVLFANILDAVPDVERLVDAIQAGVDQVGSPHIGLGSDLFGFPLAPRDLQHMGELRNLTHAMAQRGFDDPAILQILGQNFLRVFRQVWPD